MEFGGHFSRSALILCDPPGKMPNVQFLILEVDPIRNKDRNKWKPFTLGMGY
jgi:hypothetical protein